MLIDQERNKICVSGDILYALSIDSFGDLLVGGSASLVGV